MPKTRKYKPSPFKHTTISRPIPKSPKRMTRIPMTRIPETMELEPIFKRTISDLSPHFLTNRIQSYLGTQSRLPFVSANRMATMPQNYYKLQPRLNRRLVEQNLSYDNRGRIITHPIPLVLSDFKDELEQLYRKYNLTPIPLSHEDEQEFNIRMKRYGYNNGILTKEQVKKQNAFLLKYGNRPISMVKLDIPELN